ncbi:hypothetical protein NC653_023901 [Populus alba x Populus x berolinensis]|uniref:Uncharacterized protein n=1 Tax=Populus alba x Populus x berolinensis TaxID=444605 RepID=A0AAD6MJV2_9ROSI|nr:hypothetical protein NC653_023901 [Populus alba x Populus x berolinensis]
MFNLVSYFYNGHRRRVAEQRSLKCKNKMNLAHSHDFVSWIKERLSPSDVNSVADYWLGYQMLDVSITDQCGRNETCPC